MALYLEGMELTGTRILHVAPEPSLHYFLTEIASVDYLGGDLESSPFVDRQFDARSLPFEGDRFDLVLCSHVLEHIPEDIQVLREFARVLRPDGVALVQVPVDHARSVTYEDPTITDPGDRSAAFGQADHVRVYARDVLSRFRSAGMRVTWICDDEVATAEQRARYALDDTSPMRAADIYRLDPDSAP